MDLETRVFQAAGSEEKHAFTVSVVARTYGTRYHDARQLSYW